jgi:hypothetical protein
MFPVIVQEKKSARIKVTFFTLSGQIAMQVIPAPGTVKLTKAKRNDLESF